MSSTQGNSSSSATKTGMNEVFFASEEMGINITEKVITYFKGEQRVIDILNINKVHSFSDPGFAIYTFGFSAFGVLVFGIWGLISWRAEIGTWFVVSAVIAAASFCIVKEFLVRLTLYVGGKVLIPVVEKETRFFHRRINQLSAVNKIAAAIAAAKTKATAVAKSKCN